VRVLIPSPDALVHPPLPDECVRVDDVPPVHDDGVHVSRESPEMCRVERVVLAVPGKDRDCVRSLRHCIEVPRDRDARFILHPGVVDAHVSPLRNDELAEHPGRSVPGVSRVRDERPPQHGDF